jgi:hypothetical protein
MTTTAEQRQALMLAVEPLLAALLIALITL